MQAAYFDGDGVVRFVVMPDRAPEPGEATVRVEYCGFCGSDKRLLRQGATRIPGHEIVGKVIAIDDGSSSIQPGQAVAVYAILHCGGCLWCERGMPNRCSAMVGLVGWQADGGFAEQVTVPVRNLLPVPGDIPLDQAVLSLDTLGTAAHGLHRARKMMDVSRGPILVLGCGPLGLGVVAVARSQGDEVFAYDVDAARLRAAGELGARTWALQPGDVTTSSSGGKPPCHFALVVEASGAPAARALATDAVGQGGVVLMLGESEESWTLPATVSWRRTEAAWARSFYFPIDQVAENWQLVRAVGRELEQAMVSVEPFSELPRVADRFLAGKITKPVVAIGAE